MLNEINMFYSFIKISIDSHHKQSTFPRRISNLFSPSKVFFVLTFVIWYAIQNIKVKCYMIRLKQSISWDYIVD